VKFNARRLDFLAASVSNHPACLFTVFLPAQAAVMPDLRFSYRLIVIAAPPPQRHYFLSH
jgi:hypothetical protein